MKISTQTGRKEAGMATIVVIAILSIILIFVAGNLRALYLLRGDLKLVETQQTKRLARMGALTNAPPALKIPDKARDAPVPEQQ